MAQFFETRGGSLARMRDEVAMPEVFHANVKRWRPHPTLDTTHDVFPLSSDDAVALARQEAGDDSISMGDLESTADTGNAGDLYESEVRAPLRR